MRITPVTLNQVNRKNNEHFGMSLSISKGTDDFIRNAVKNREIDPINWLATSYVLSNSKAHYEIIKKDSGFLNLFSKLFITRIAEGEDSRVAVATVEEFFDKIKTLDRSLGEEIDLTAQQITHNLLDNVRYISSGKPTISVEPRKFNIFDGLKKNKNM